MAGIGLPGQPPQFRQDLGGYAAVRRAPPAGRLQHGFDLIERRQREVNQLGGNLEPSVANFVESVFEVVTEPGQFVKAKHRPGTLDGMQRAESAPHKFGVVRILVKCQERRLQLDQNLTRFFQEG